VTALEREVREVMTPGVVTISGDASLHRVHQALAAHGVNAVLVVERKGGRPLGWITAQRLLRIAAADTHLQTAGQAVSEPVQVISPSASVAEAVELLLADGVSHLLVAHGADCMPEGVVSAFDIVSAA
jgi:CBS domain-containing protein